MKTWPILNKTTPKPAAFIDRDGTLTRDRAGIYVTETAGLKLYVRAARALRLLADKGYRLIVLTNQSGVARGYMSLECAKAINLRLKKLLKEKGARLDAVYFCPHGPDAGCSCRKPRTGLVREALKDFRTDLKASIVIGDKASDMQMAKKSGITPLFVTTGQGRGQLKKHPAALKGVSVFRDILSAARSAPDRIEPKNARCKRQNII
ncbi:MAG: HAD-IIIA family hydrolase [Elusimicrobia bacterium]|nr:HAD-IIIA family hydrolase [Elusimicrobiota bacterium]